MKPHKYMRQRGGKWTIVRKVPTDVVEQFGRKQVWRSLNTGDLSMANTRYLAVMAEIEAEFDKARLNQASSKPMSLNTVDIEWIARNWFYAEVTWLLKPSA